MPIINYLSHSNSLIAIKDAQQSLSYAQLHQAVQARANFLKQLKVQRIALLLDNSVEWVLFDLASQLAELCLIPIPRFFSTQQVQHVLAQSAVELIVEHNSNNIFPFAVKLKAPFSNINLFLMNAEQLGNTPLIPPNTSKITFTSGSTGSPKGVCLDAKSQRVVAQSLVDAIDIKQPLHLSLLPLPTLLENIAGVYAPLLANGTVILTSEQERGFVGSQLVDHHALLNLVHHTQPTSTILVPELLQFFLHAIKDHWQAPRSFKFIAVGGGKLSTKLLRAAEQAKLPVYQGYGLSEAISVVSLNTLKSNKLGSCGQLLPHSKAYVENGELVVTDNIFLGYLNQPDSWGATKVHTGDLVEITDTTLAITGRKSNVIINSFGRNISPEWLEAEFLACGLFKHFIAFGDAKPYCIALFVPANTEIASALITKVIEQVNKTLPDYGQIKRWQCIEESVLKQAQLFTDNGRPKRQQIQHFYSQQINSLYRIKPIETDNTSINDSSLFETESAILPVTA